jgi:hypothetical protein
VGHEPQFPLLQLSARCQIDQATFDGNARDAPRVVTPWSAVGRSLQGPASPIRGEG